MARAMRDSQGVPDINSVYSWWYCAGALGACSSRLFASCSDLRSTLGRIADYSRQVKKPFPTRTWLVWLVVLICCPSRSGGGLGAGTRQE